MLRISHFTAAVTLAAVLSLASTTQADVVFNIRPGAGGLAIFDITGSGQALDGGSTILAETNSIDWPSSIATSLRAFTPGVTLDGSEISLGFSENNLLIVLNGPFATGAQLSELDGSYLSGIDFAEFTTPGQFLFTNVPAEFRGNIGDITVNIASVPEPSSLLVLSLIHISEPTRPY